jgi:hypothetical protein
MPSRPSSPTRPDSSEEVILLHGRNKPATVALPATAVTVPAPVTIPATAATSSKRRVGYTEPPPQLTASAMPNPPATAVIIPASAVTSTKRRVKYTEPPLHLTASTMPDPPATAVTLPASAVISSNEDAERQFQLKVDEYRQEMLAHARSGAPPAIVNPHRPGCYHYCKWERSVEMGRVCAGDDCNRTIGKGVQFLMACRDHDCGLLACFTHQRKVTNHSTRSTARGRRTGL